ncbi:hypothetical protein FN846DRAFT_906116 [Sphaerosporella brunnea]|uniref:Uncharacterized protein n=1 Tax=Sphaerosporella brunnea TaxID=1250544 RepID=A0A5J5EZU5_9PEZI|nr:hypothetical protein FN846DRAFT_906116 [Sphaerosporella brunnea]
MSKLDLRNIIRLEDDKFAQWKAPTKNILIKEGESAIVCRRSKRPIIPTACKTSETAGPQLEHSDNAGVHQALEARNNLDTAAESASATIQLTLGPKALQRVAHVDHSEPQRRWEELTKMYGTTRFSGLYHAFRSLIGCELGERTCSE